MNPKGMQYESKLGLARHSRQTGRCPEGKGKDTIVYMAVSRLFASSIEGGTATLLKGRIGKLSSHSWPPKSRKRHDLDLVLTMKMNTHSAVPVSSERKAHSTGVAAPSGAIPQFKNLENDCKSIESKSIF